MWICSVRNCNYIKKKHFNSVFIYFSISQSFSQSSSLQSYFTKILPSQVFFLFILLISPPELSKVLSQMTADFWQFGWWNIKQNSLNWSKIDEMKGQWSKLCEIEANRRKKKLKWFFLLTEYRLLLCTLESRCGCGRASSGGHHFISFSKNIFFFLILHCL